MPLDVARLRDSDLAAEASGEEFRAAVLLWCAAWHQVPAGSIPNDDKVIAHLAGYGRAPKEWKKVRAGALRGFVECSDGRLYHPHVADKANEAWASREKFAEKREQDRERLRIWRERKRAGNGDGNNDETRFGNEGETRTKPLRQGTGDRGDIPLDKSNGKTDPEKVMFDTGIAMLVAQGKSEPQARALLGKWKRDHGTGQVIEMLGAAQRMAVVDIASWAEGRWRGGAGAKQPAIGI